MDPGAGKSMKGFSKNFTLFRKESTCSKYFLTYARRKTLWFLFILMLSISFTPFKSSAACLDVISCNFRLISGLHKYTNELLLIFLIYFSFQEVSFLGKEVQLRAFSSKGFKNPRWRQGESTICFVILTQISHEVRY